MNDQKQKSISKLELPVEDSGRTAKEGSPTRLSRSGGNIGSNSARHTNINSSPTRSTPAPPPQSTVPSAAAVQRAMSALKPGTSNLEGTLDSTKERLQKLGQNSPSWPTSPRLKSPPPTTPKSMLPRRTESEHAQSNTAIKRLAPGSNPDSAAVLQVPQDVSKDQQGQVSTRGPSRGASQHGHGLETVAEDSVSTIPSIGPAANTQGAKIAGPALNQIFESSAESSSTKNDTATVVETTSKPSATRSDNSNVSAPVSRATSNSRPESILAKRSFTNLTGSKSKSAIEPLRSMTVETETVNSTPQVIGDRGRDAGGSIRTRTSNETIRPKKEKKKPARKTPSLQAGTATSKADIFEAKVASAVEEADSSDSDETFVYESNPRDHRESRHHSRTPSATSVASQADYHGGRSKHGVRSGSTVIPGKRSMKFSSSLYGAQLEADGSGGDGSRNSSRTQNSTPRHHHIGRHGRSGHASIIDSDSPFTQANRIGSPRTPTTTNMRYSRPNSPRLSNGRLVTTGRKSAAGTYDNYDDGADDERAPLVGSVRVNRARQVRRPNGHFRSMEFDDPAPGCWSRFGGCILLALLFIMVSMGLTTFVVALNRPLLDVEVRHIQNVLVSEQELMLDLHVRATNPNLFAISVNDLDVNLFAESPYAGTSEEWERHHPAPRSSWMKRRQDHFMPSHNLRSWFPPFHQGDGIDEGTDPIDEEPGPQKMLLGRITEFDSPLIFDASPIRHSNMSSVGEIRLAKPGNRTEIGGSARWERVLHHPFDLIVRGVIKYQLPLSSRTRSAKISGRVKVSPDVDNGGDEERDRNSTTPERAGRTLVSMSRRELRPMMANHLHMD